jgi:predicted O-linked N-acetylglucosamine transferase (SPINDLY family)
MREALATCDRALALQPDDPDLLANRGNALYALKRFGEAGETFARLVALAPDYDYAAGILLRCRLLCCDWADVAERTRDLERAVESGRRVVHPFAFLVNSQSPSAQLQCARTYVADQCPPAARPVAAGRAYRRDRIRIAYLSTKYHDHAGAYLTAGLFEAHDRQRFEITAVSLGPAAEGGMRERLVRAFDRFVDVRGRSDVEVAQMLAEAEIDIAVDLTGHAADSRPGILAHRPAPIQVNFLGFPGTLGADYIDYIVADRFVIPPGDEAWYAEQVVRLPDTYQVNDGKRRIAELTSTRAEAGLPDTGFVFCCFNHNYKIMPEIFDIWMRLLDHVPGSVLWLLEDNVEAAASLRREAERRGVGPERLVFAPRRALDEHLARHRLADLFVDTLPYNAHTTASDALWAGLPVVTCMGRTFAGRVAGSLLDAVGLPDLVTHSLPDYGALALKLATTPDMLSAIRARLARNRTTYPLFDTDRFRRHLESAYATMWERHQRGLPPAGFAVEAIG